ncbi:MAG: OmpH family outer membrane protein [Candidatus Wallbacteria bacterium]|nr:OmpH family outer membrane protein [Candidatus Wallbacteria bacterium]
MRNFLPLLLLVLTVSLYAEVKIGCVSMGQVLETSKKAQKIHQNMQKHLEDRQKTFDVAREKLEAEEQSLQSKLEKLSENDRKTQQEAFEKKVAEIQEMGAKFEQELSAIEKKETEGLKEEIHRVIKLIAEREKLTFVMEKEAMYFGGIDITGKVIAELDKGL